VHRLVKHHVFLYTFFIFPQLCFGFIMLFHYG
jgi:hypothetical protein